MRRGLGVLAVLCMLPCPLAARTPSSAAAPAAPSAGLAAAPLPAGVVLISDQGMQAEYRDPRSVKAVARALQAAFDQAGDGECAPGAPGGEAVLVCTRTALIDAETSDTVQVAVVPGGAGATRLLVEHAFGVVGKRHAPSEPHQVMAPALLDPGAISPTQRALRAIPMKGEPGHSGGAAAPGTAPKAPPAAPTPPPSPQR